MTILSLPGCETAPPPHRVPPAFRFAHAAAAPEPRRRAEIDVAGIGRLLGMAGRPARAIVATIRKLIEKHGFPHPRTPRFVKSRRLTGADAVCARSLWARDQVEQWFDDDTPPAVAARAAGAGREQVRAELAERARALVA